MGSNPGYLRKYFLLYLVDFEEKKRPENVVNAEGFLSFFDNWQNEIT